MKSKLVIVALFSLHASACIADLSVEPPVPSDACDPVGLEPLADAFPDCDLGMCGDGEEARARGRCVDSNQLGPDQLALLAPCENGYSHCVPLALLFSDGRFKPPTCASIGGAEGRCMSLCVPDVAAKADQLPVDVCEEGERCAPCFDPITGEPTGSCEISHCDAPEEPPFTFERCCEDRAVCVPSDMVPESKRDSLEQSTCAGANELCAPIENTDPTYVAPSCQDFWGNQGACISTCVPATSLGSTEPECPPDTKCVLCEVLGVATGACE